MTEQERQELEQCRRDAESCTEAVGRSPLSHLGGIESTIRSQLQEYVSPTIGAFFAKPPVEPAKDIPASSTASSDD